MRLIRLLGSAMAISASTGCGAPNVVWKAACIASCSQGATVADSETICISSETNVSSVEQTSADDCVNAVRSNHPGCVNPECACSATNTGSGC